MIGVGICDNERKQMEKITAYVREFFENEKIECKIKATTNGEEILESGNQYDIIFLDIEMGDKSGIDIARILRKNNKKFKLIYVTAYKEYRLSAENTRYFAYLSKPFSKEDIRETLRDAIDYLIDEQQTIGLARDKYTFYFNINDIIYIKREGRSINLYTYEEINECRFNYTLKEIEEILKTTNKFALINRYCLINMDYITQKNSISVKMQNNDIIPISRRKEAEFSEIFKNYICRGEKSGKRLMVF